MKNMLMKGIAVFFVLVLATTILIDVFKMDFGTVNYWQVHGVFLLFFLAIFPRLTLLFSSIPFGGFFWWVGFFFFPRILIAGLATVTYFHTNPVLVVMAWLVALGGEVFEKYGIGRGRFQVRTFNMGSRSPSYTGEEAPQRPPHTVVDKNDVIEAEFTKKD